MHISNIIATSISNKCFKNKKKYLSLFVVQLIALDIIYQVKNNPSLVFGQVFSDLLNLAVLCWLNCTICNLFIILLKSCM